MTATSATILPSDFRRHTGLAIADAMWATSPYVRMRVMSVPDEIAASPTRYTSSGAPLEFWKNSLLVLHEAPVLGHGTGTIVTRNR